MPTSKQDVSMRDLLASCAAANAVSTPPGATDADADPAADALVRDAREANPAAAAAEEDRQSAPDRRRAA